jgi:hypothetical protein
MNRKEDLMRHSSGEKTDLKADLLKNSFILFFLIFSSLSFSQIPINGFCYQKNYPIPKGYEAVTSADINSNGNDELLFYSASTKRIGIYSGNPGEIVLLKEFQLTSEISQLRQLKDKSGNTNLFAALDRKHRKILLIHISIDSIAVKENQIEFDSYPENIFTSDIDLNGKEEILVYGSGFDGLSVVSRANEGVGERKIIIGTSFSEAIFNDFSGDGYPDVIAFNILENSLQFFTNNTKGIFRLNRSIQYSEKISLLKSRDFNNDGFYDLIYSIGNSLEILFGDFQGSFKTKKIIKLDDRPTGIIFGDFNGDKLLDISYSLYNGTLNTIFAKKESDFYESITYIRNLSSVSITKFSFTGLDNVVCFLESGDISIIMSAKELNEELKIVPAIQAGALKKFDYGNDNISDISFVDEYDNYLKIFLVNKSGIPVSLYYFPLAEDHKEIIVDDFYKQIKTFYCFIEGTPLLEVFKYNFKTNKLNRKQLYAPGEILDLRLQRVDSSLVNVFIAYNKQLKLHLGKFENRDLSITFKEYPFIDRNVSVAKIRIQEEPEVFYWKLEKDTFYFKMADIESGPNIYKTYFEIPKSEKLDIKLYGASRYFNDYPTVVSIVQNEAQKNLLSVVGNKFYLSSKIFNDQASKIKDFGRGFFGETTIKGIINFTVNTVDDDYINTIIYSEKEKSYLLRRTFAVDNVTDYFFIKPDQKNYYLVFTNAKGELSITSVKK